MLFIVSQVSLVTGGPDPSAAPGQGDVRVSVSRADGVKCVRCWRYVPAVAADEQHAGLCARCVTAVSEPAAAAGSRA
jgi:isoleucyl-tRNA synthetase